MTTARTSRSCAHWDGPTIGVLDLRKPDVKLLWQRKAFDAVRVLERAWAARAQESTATR